MNRNDLAVQHLLLRLRPINRWLRRAAGLQTEKAARLNRPDLKPLCITDQHVAALLGDVDEFAELFREEDESPPLLTVEEHDIEEQLRKQAQAQRVSLPLDVLADSLQLAAFDIDALLICAAPQCHSAYERLFAYILDDLNRRFPCVELICSFSSPIAGQRLRRRSELGPSGRLQRCGLLEPFGETTTGARTQLRLAAGVLDFLLDVSSTVAGIWRDADEIDIDCDCSSLVGAIQVQLQRIGRAIGEDTIGIAGVWDPHDCGADVAAQMIAQAAGKRLRRLRFADDSSRPASSQVRGAVHTAAALNSILFVQTDSLQDIEHHAAADALIQYLVSCHVPAVFTGTVPWRPTALLANRTYAELSLSSADQPTREQMWSRAVSGIKQHRASELAGRFRMSRDEMQAVSRTAHAQAALESNGKPASVDDHLDSACAAVAQKTRGRFLGSLRPKRGPDDLILPPDLHRQVLEIAGFTRVLPRVAETWGFARLATGGTGLKCLFTGDPGTGKTLAAEVIASQVGTPLLKVNIAELVSKWVGETEKNLDAAFREAASSHAVLFFDEADALFGKRGEVQHGIDRYANLEVSHLLQRLEDHDGLVILASNLKDNIDSAFIRRFHVLLHFPRPREGERRRIWEIAFPPQAPLDQQVDVSSLASLDITGAGIMAAARTAALLAAKEDANRINMSHVVRGVARQFRREARVLSTSDLGPYASLLQDEP